MAASTTKKAARTFAPDSPEVQARVAAKRAEAARTAEHAARAAFATPTMVGSMVFFPPNSQTLDALAQPAFLQLSSQRFLILVAYVLTLPHAQQIAASADPLALRNAAAQWQDSVPPDLWPRVAELASTASQWLQAKMAGDAFFFRMT